MPLSKGKGHVHENIRELVRSFKEKGSIGNTKPGSMRKAKSIASAIAYRKSRERK